MKRFFKGSKMLWKSTGLPAFEKLDDNEWGNWVSLDSTYLVERKVVDPVTKKETSEYDLKPESEKPLYNKEGRLNRYGFKWPDKQVFEHYKGFMNFEYAAVD